MSRSFARTGRDRRMQQMENDEGLVPLRRARSALANAISGRVAPAAHELSVVEDGVLRCLACAHRCAFDGDRTGACGVRESRAGAMVAPFGYVARRYVRNVETNTVYHVEPG